MNRTGTGLAIVGVAVLTGCGSDGAADGASSAAESAELSALRAGLATIAHRLELVEDANDIKRLQRAYGYYLDHGRWDDLADLFSDDATLEIGLDGVYRGRDRIAAYFTALGAGRDGLAPGQLNEHMQLMPVVTVAPDGLSARGRWRDIVMHGQFGEFAAWGEGPFENEYVEEDGVWKISTLHWFQTMLVDFDGGWHENEDFNGARWVGDALAPDAPTSWPYEPWPGTWLPPFHFENPVLGATAVDLGQFAPPLLPESAGLGEIARAGAEIAQAIALVEAENEIENLQRIYGFYIEEGFWSEAASLFADDGVFEIAGVGQFRGAERIRAYLRSLGAEFPQPGRLYDQMQLQPIVHVAPDGMTARARWRLFAQEAKYGDFSEWGVGWYENDYVHEDGVWKIAHLRLFNRMYTPDQEGWGRTALPGPTFALRSGLAPDAESTLAHALYPETSDPQFHYPNPVTGGPVYGESPEDFAQVPDVADATGLSAWLDGLAARVERLEDVEQIERLRGIYGYYLASYSMDDLAGIFSDDGTIEIALRGVYAGKASVRRRSATRWPDTGRNIARVSTRAGGASGIRHLTFGGAENMP